MHIWTENPIAAMWEQLRYLENAKNVEGLLTGRIPSGRTTTTWEGSQARRASEISSCLEQADEYFSAAESVSLTTKPLLLYYGIQSLSKAMILALDEASALVDLKYHGLSSRPNSSDLRQYRDDSSRWTLEDEFAVVKDGVFVDTMARPAIVSTCTAIPTSMLAVTIQCSSAEPMASGSCQSSQNSRMASSEPKGTIKSVIGQRSHLHPRHRLPE